MIVCRNCGSDELICHWSLKDAPYGDLFRETEQAARRVKLEPFRLVSCCECELLQLGDVTNIEIQYDNYLYKTGITVGLDSHYSRVANYLSTLFLENDSSILDIGSNDGSFLKHFKSKGYEVLGVEPSSSPSQQASAQGITTLHAYFSSSFAKLELLPKWSRFDLISLNYTLANVPDVRDILFGVEALLSDRGVVSIITGYHPDQFSVNMFDYIGHDHLSYFSLSTLMRCLDSVGLRVIDAIRSEDKGGSLQVIATRNKSRFSPQARVRQVLQREEWSWSSNTKIVELRQRVLEVKSKINSELEKVGSKILGIGASISTSYLVNEFSISNHIAYLVDDDTSKIGKFSPYYGLEVLSFEDSQLKDYNLALILAWQHTNVLLNRLRDIRFKGRVLIPLPEPKWIELK